MNVFQLLVMGFLRVLRFPHPVKLTFHYHHHRLDMTLAVAEELSPNKLYIYTNRFLRLIGRNKKALTVNNVFNHNCFLVRPFKSQIIVLSYNKKAWGGGGGSVNLVKWLMPHKENRLEHSNEK